VALAARDGALRNIGGTIRSHDWVTAGVAGDQNGDRLTDVAVSVAGSHPRLTVLRGTNAQSVWNRTDVPLFGMSRLLPARHGPLGSEAPDLVLHTDPDPGVVGAVQVPYQPDDPTGLTPLGVDDPTAANEGTVMLLAHRTGQTLWTRPGHAFYIADETASARIVVGTDTTTSSSDRYEIRIDVALISRTGTVLWSRPTTRTVDRDFNCTAPRTYLYLTGLADTDADGLGEGRLAVSTFQCDYGFAWTTLLSGRDGRPLKDQTSTFLTRSVTRTGADRYHVASTSKGLRLRILRGRDSHTLIDRLLANSQGQNDAIVTAAPLSRTPCADLLVFGLARVNNLVTVLASNGSPRWWLAGPVIEGQPQHPRQPALPPRNPAAPDREPPETRRPGRGTHGTPVRTRAVA
jgi:hypothetical protein